MNSSVTIVTIIKMCHSKQKLIKKNTFGQYILFILNCVIYNVIKPFRDGDVENRLSEGYLKVTTISTVF